MRMKTKKWASAMRSRDDGVNWEKPDLGLVEFAGESTRTTL